MNYKFKTGEEITFDVYYLKKFLYSVSNIQLMRSHDTDDLHLTTGNIRFYNIIASQCIFVVLDNDPIYCHVYLPNEGLKSYCKIEHKYLIKVIKL